MNKILLTCLMTGTVVAAPLPDYPVVYDPTVRGPVQNPAYAKTRRAVPAATPLQQPPPALPEAYAAQRHPATTAQHYPRYMDSSNYEFTLSVNYGFKACPDNAYACDMLGFELEGAYYLTNHQAITLSFGFAGGGDDENFWVIPEDAPPYPWTDSYDRSSITLALGYRFSHRLGRFCELQVGAKCGLDVQSLDTEFGYGWSDPYYDNPWDCGKRDTVAGMIYAGYVNICFPIARNGSFFVGYQYRGSTAKPSAKYGFPYNMSIETGSMRWHEVRLGVNLTF